MFKHVEYNCEGVCSSKIEFDIVDGFIHHVKFTGGCAGNTKGVATLAEGLRASDVARRLENVGCRPDGNSCPRQFSIAIKQALENYQED